MQLQICPAGVTEINSRVAVEAKDGQVCYVYGHLPVFQHEETDVRKLPDVHESDDRDGKCKAERDS